MKQTKPMGAVQTNVFNLFVTSVTKAQKRTLEGQSPCKHNGRETAFTSPLGRHLPGSNQDFGCKSLSFLRTAITISKISF
jgi:hypothetical protein